MTDEAMLTPEQVQQLLLEGDTSTEIDDKQVPPTEPTEEELNAENAVILAKDNKHTISYDKLVEAREAAKEAKARADGYQSEIDTLKQELESVKTNGAGVNLAIAEKAIAEGADPAMFGDFSENAIAEGIFKLVNLRVEAKVKDIQADLDSYKQKQVELQAQSHAEQILAKHPDISEIVESVELEAYILSKPAAEQVKLRNIVDKGTTKQVVDMFDDYKKSSYFMTDEKIKEQASAKTASAKGVPAPISLTDVPTGNTGHSSKEEAMVKMDGVSLLGAMQDMTPEQIQRYLDNL